MSVDSAAFPFPTPHEDAKTRYGQHAHDAEQERQYAAGNQSPSSIAHHAWAARQRAEAEYDTLPEHLK